MEEISNTSSHILFFDGATRVGNSIHEQIRKTFPGLNVTVVALTDNENHLSYTHENLVVVGYSLGARRALDWATKKTFKGSVYLLDPECWKPSRVYGWATQNQLGKIIFLFVVKVPLFLNLFTWLLPKRMRKQVQLFVQNKAFRNQLYQDWLAAAQFQVKPIESLGLSEDQLTVVTSGDAIFLKYIPIENIKQQGIKILTLEERSHSQLWKHFFKDQFNPNANSL
ncbi:MAG: hypothetical protein U0U66_01430 [Cytophagaceae bacterium]